ncbi:hypothetical protein GCM10022252_03760 [Streptosporangium oxazolinicum]|uniref:Uncharacterized protein n=1 Tax=Streptosporangium oxazolinicum TaxID=909287 RepID=A0ABP8AA11_9ACTN
MGKGLVRRVANRGMILQEVPDVVDLSPRTHTADGDHNVVAFNRGGSGGDAHGVAPIHSSVRTSAISSASVGLVAAMNVWRRSIASAISLKVSSR